MFVIRYEVTIELVSIVEAKNMEEYETRKNLHFQYFRRKSK